MTREAFPKHEPLPPPNKIAGVKPLTMGCFYEPSEYSFEISAYTAEGEPILDVQSSMQNVTFDPFGRDNYSVDSSEFLQHYVEGTSEEDIKRCRDSLDYHWWQWNWWRRYGGVNSFRGNWLVRDGQGSWENANQILFHRSLGSYGTTQGEPPLKECKENAGTVNVPYATEQTYGMTFINDIEKCNVAFVFTHGGKIHGVFQIKQRPEVWTIFPPVGNYYPTNIALGGGSLRHLFFDSCGSFTYRNEPNNACLIDTWIRKLHLNGLRTASGFDGTGGLWDRAGWRFFGYYNKWESISDSWILADLDENPDGCAASAGYGETINDAIETLLRGRFSDERAGTQYIAVSYWLSDNMGQKRTDGWWRK